MAGHSKWANIKRQKARVDAAKSKVFTRLSREIIVAARSGADPEGNFQLRNAINKAKAAGIPNDNIDRAIAKGAGKFGAESDNFEAIRYEGYGPGGVAILVEALTDNRNRTAADLRVAFSKNGGNLGETGCVSWMFDRKGVVTISGSPDEEQLLEASLEGGAESYQLLEENEETPASAEVFAAVEDLESLSQALQNSGFTVTDAELRWIPGNTVEVTDASQARSLLKLMDALEELDDVQNVTANFEMTDELMANSF
ncbi:MAG TPA: YebC/PmpR family DNA-binding transcriptional regulator [Oscillatoriales cyanobacterium M59_W2019_021]|nr:MAG: YebC/PmpR family DNA-binding transcriptional regulator [Cyanobacteria bacterium J055]HIK33858.1 YebC/PmpR family DNA-binding transcriptional regulator [Oscillatoriales cyanobacterium M4454_W2019_049]HIK51686.1 YebC/PmpR family DNA-binding transcriptional regulator [Oscillatoriales cyanobacterium M59_W2019_021]